MDEIKKMNELKNDVQQYYKWAQITHEDDELNELIFNLEGTIEQINKRINGLQSQHG